MVAKGSAKKAAAAKKEVKKVEQPAAEITPIKAEKNKKEKVKAVTPANKTENKENKSQNNKSAEKGKKKKDQANKPEARKEEKEESIVEKVAETEPPVQPKEVKLLEKSKIDEGSTAFLKLLEGQLKKEENDLLDEGTVKVVMQVSGIKLAPDADKCTIKARLPHSCLPADSDVLLIVKDIERGIKSDHENTLLHYQDLLKEHNVTAISEVMPLRQLKVEYKDFEAKRQLYNRFEKVLVDDRIIRLIPQFLGNAFYKRNKFPVQVSLTKKNLKEEIARCISTELMPLRNHGSCAAITVGNSNMDAATVAANTEVAVRAIETRYPGGWKNVRSLHLSSNNTSLPLYLTDRTPQEVGKVESSAHARNIKKSVRDELSTIPGSTVIVHPSGHVKVKRDAAEEWKEDEEWKSKKQRRAEQKEQEAKEAEEAAKEEEKEESEAKDARKKEKEKKKDNKKGKKAEEEEESEDDLEDMETEYMRKVAEEEEEIERKEQENLEKLGGSTANKADSEAEESEADDDIEAEDLVSGDEDEDTEDAILMNRPDDAEIEEEEETQKKKKASKKDKKKKAKLEAKTSQKKEKKKGGKGGEGKKKKSK